VTSLRARLKELYQGTSGRAQNFRYALLGFDLVTIVFVVLTSFVRPNAWILWIDMIFGAVILLDFAARWWIAPRRVRFLFEFSTVADVAAMISFLAPLFVEGFGFLRILRTVRLLRTYEVLVRLRQDFSYFRLHESVITATLNLGVFLFVMTGLIYALQHDVNPDIGNYADALYFTVTTLTTTGFGDVILTGTAGRMLSVAVMIFGVTLFLRLAQVLFRPRKVRQECSTCGLLLHDADAVHCKHCGEIIRIETEGLI
jgi:voltage-gated potassium channel